MQIQTVAEGIEVDEQAEVLRTLGCELGQGFFFAKPLAADAWATLLRTDGVGSGDDTFVLPGADETAVADASQAGPRKTGPRTAANKGAGAAASSAAKPRRRAAA
jgi:predicted signal transduction protein with EAL and GGDEF domain